MVNSGDFGRLIWNFQSAWRALVRKDRGICKILEFTRVLTDFFGGLRT
jgi:hypothetical protein